VHELLSFFHAVPDADLYPAEIGPIGALPDHIVQHFIVEQEREAHARTVGGRVVQAPIRRRDELDLNARIIIVAVSRVRHFDLGYVTGSGDPLAMANAMTRRLGELNMTSP
jgi:hypothetical protein